VFKLGGTAKLPPMPKESVEVPELAPPPKLTASADVVAKGEQLYGQNCALCHGVAILRYARLSNGEPLVRGKTVTGFANVEEDFADNAVWSMKLMPCDRHLMPWRIEDELRKLGANYVQAGLWRGFAVRDGNLITGQQNFSGEETARLLIDTLGH